MSKKKNLRPFHDFCFSGDIDGKSRSTRKIGSPTGTVHGCAGVEIFAEFSHPSQTIKPLVFEFQNVTSPGKTSSMRLGKYEPLWIFLHLPVDFDWKIN